MPIPECALRVLAVEGFFGASHAAFLEGLAARSAYDWRLLTLPARRWRDRMLKGHKRIAQEAARLDEQFDLLFVTDMVDFAGLLELLPGGLAGLPSVFYFHENQLTYPVRRAGEDYWQFGLLNITSAMAADRVLFNSEFHRRAFLDAMPGFLESLPVGVTRPPGAVRRIAGRGTVAHPGIDVDGFPCPDRSGRVGPLTILWNHRWEHDKRPEVFFDALDGLVSAGCDFRVVICGENFSRRPEVFDRAREALGERLLHFGFAESRSEYAELLGRADVVVSTAAHEFFGIAWLEACAAGCMPLLPDRLSYPGLVPQDLHQKCIYGDDREFFQRLRELCADPAPARKASATWRAVAERYAWSRQAAVFDQLFAEAAGGRQVGGREEG